MHPRLALGLGGVTAGGVILPPVLQEGPGGPVLLLEELERVRQLQRPGAAVNLFAKDVQERDGARPSGT